MNSFRPGRMLDPVLLDMRDPGSWPGRGGTEGMLSAPAPSIQLDWSPWSRASPPPPAGIRRRIQ